jgi:hypothetical protein
MKASKNYNNVVDEEWLAHTRTIVVSLGGKLTHVFFYAPTELHQRMYVVIFRVLILFYCWWPCFVVCGFSRTIRAYECIFYCLWRLFCCLCLAVGPWYEKHTRGMTWKTPLYGDVSEKTNLVAYGIHIQTLSRFMYLLPLQPDHSSVCSVCPESFQHLVMTSKFCNYQTVHQNRSYE